MLGMTVKRTENGKELILVLAGRLDTANAPKLEAELKNSISGLESLILDFASIEYVSSAGLRVLLAAQKMMNKQGKMVVKNVSETVNEVFEITGFCDILTIE